MPTADDSLDRSITAESLHRDFGQLHAVDGVDLEVPGGQIFGFLGPNGAGKSTLVKILTTILNPTAAAPRSPATTSSGRAARCARRSASPSRTSASTRS